MNRPYERLTPPQIKARLGAGGEVLLWDHNGGHAKVLRVESGKNARVGVDSVNTTIWFAGGAGEVPFRVNSAAPVKVVRAAAAQAEGETL